MKVLAKIINFFKHLVLDFAKPVSRKSSPINTTSTYEELTKELETETIVTNEPTHVTHELETPTRFRRLAASYQEQEHGRVEPVVVMSEVATMAEPKVVEVFVPEVVTTTFSEEGERVIDFVFAEVAPVAAEAEAPKKTRKKAATKAPAKKTTKKVVKKNPTVRRKKKVEKEPTPPEAMGFGF